jgi:hypothetical protein
MRSSPAKEGINAPAANRCREFVNTAAIVRLQREDDSLGWLAILADEDEVLLAPYYSAPGRVERDFPHLVPRARAAAAPVLATVACQAEACCAL